MWHIRHNFYIPQLISRERIKLQSWYWSQMKACRNVRDFLPAKLRDNFNLKLVSRFGKTIGSKILNYNDVLRNSEVSNYGDILDMSCNCESSPLRSAHFGHVITGDLDIIQNSNLRKLCSFGTKFRENPVLNVGRIRGQFGGNVDSFVAKVSRKLGVPRSAFHKWKRRLIGNFSDKLYGCLDGYAYSQPVLSNRDSKLELDRLKMEYVITVVDKAANNFSFTCKKFYFLKLAEELGMNNINIGNETYLYVDTTEADIVEKTKLDMVTFNLVPDSKQGKLALLYQTPKFHKNPPKMRYIAGNINTVTSRLDNIVALILKMCKTHFKNYCRKSRDFSGIRYDFDVQTSMEVKGMFGKAHGFARSISINDFSTLYTLFDHDHLLGNMRWLLEKLSKNSNRYHIKVSYSKAWWVAGSSEGSVYGLTEIMDMIDYLVRNAYIKAFGSVFNQVKGIIMGGRSSGWLSDCSLMVDEFRYVDGKIKAGSIDDARRLEYFCRYRDDCTTINLDNFLGIASDIYPPSLTLTQENEQIDRANVLDMEVTIQDGVINTKVYCKADYFPFGVISLPFLESNLDNRICYRVFFGQVVRFQRLTSHRVDFEVRVKFLYDILRDRDYSKRRLKGQFCKAVERYLVEFQKWSLPLDFQAWFYLIVN